MGDQFKVPFAFEGDDVATVEQDSHQEIVQSIRAIIAYHIGERLDLPEFGIKDPSFKQGGTNLTALYATIKRWEPRAEIVIERDPSLLKRLIDDITIREG